MLKLKRNNKGQTALEYALVIGVIAIGIIAAAKIMFSGEKSPAKELFTGAIDNAKQQVASQSSQE